ncbi:MAG: ORF6N domain-containing protein [Elusimicrobiota bacterium]
MRKIALVDVEIGPKIYLIRGQRVMLDRDLAELYGVETFNLNKAVKRNLDRFPLDFMFQLTGSEYGSLRFQIGILEQGAHSKYLPYAFTEQGVAMLSSVLRSKRAVSVNIAIMRAFVRLRQALAADPGLAERLKNLEGRVVRNESDIKTVFEDIRDLLRLPKSPKPRIGFRLDQRKANG